MPRSKDIPQGRFSRDASESKTQKLPQEVIDFIIDIVAIEHDLGSLAQCRLTSRAWCTRCQIHFSRYFVINSSLGFNRLVGDSHRPGFPLTLRRVRSLMLTDCSASDRWLHLFPARLGGVFTQITSLSLSNWTIGSPHHHVLLVGFVHFPAVRDLGLCACVFDNALQFQRIVGSFHQLARLFLRDVVVRCLPGDRQPAASAPPKLARVAFWHTHRAGPNGRAKMHTVAGHLARWLSHYPSYLKGLEGLELHINAMNMPVDELTNIGSLVDALSANVKELIMDFEEDPRRDKVTDWRLLQIHKCDYLTTVSVLGGSSDLDELALLSPDSHIQKLELARRWWLPSAPCSTGWPAFASRLQDALFCALQTVWSTRICKSVAEEAEMQAVVHRLRSNGITFFEDQFRHFAS